MNRIIHLLLILGSCIQISVGFQHAITMTELKSTKHNKKSSQLFLFAIFIGQTAAFIMKPTTHATYRFAMNMFGTPYRRFPLRIQLKAFTTQSSNDDDLNVVNLDNFKQPWRNTTTTNSSTYSNIYSTTNKPRNPNKNRFRQHVNPLSAKFQVPATLHGILIVAVVPNL